jgi:hypothetical protein
MPGQVTDVLPDPVLTGIMVELGTGGPGAAEIIAPVARVARDEFKYGKFKREDIKDDVQTKKAPGQPASEVDFGVTYASGSVEYHKLKSRIPDAIRANDAFNTLDTRRTKVLTNKLLLGVEKRIQNLCHAAANTKAAPAIKWDAANATIRADILAGKAAFRLQAGMNPNAIVIPPAVYDVLANDAEVLELVKRNRDMLASEVLETILQMRVVVPGAIVDQSNPGAAQSIANVWADDEAYYLYVDDTAGDDLDALTALRQVRSMATGAQGMYTKKYRDSDESAEADWVSAHINQTEIVPAAELILRQLDVLT